MPLDAPAADPPLDSADLAKAFQELAKGEKTASAMENQLTALERKIDDLLASVDEQGQQIGQTRDASTNGNSDQS